jgi:predicted phage terminase large subunit-like protein
MDEQRGSGPINVDRLALQVIAAKRDLASRAAREHMIDYMRYMSPDPDRADDPMASYFEITPLARLLCQIIEKVDRGELNRVAVSVGPQFGKSDVLSRRAPAWLSGRRPRRNMILGSYNDTFAQEFGDDVRTTIQAENHRHVFPGHELKKGSESKANLTTTKGGKMAFVGVGGSGTGKPADIFFVDDPYKNDQDAQSEGYRETVWRWFTGVVFARCHKNSAIIIVHTRWHEDDLIGRLCDPDHPERNKRYKGIADRWAYYNLPAIVEDPTLANALDLTLEVPKDPLVIEQFGSKPMASLWENRKSLAFLAEAKQSDSRIFNALYMGKPAPESGTYFLAENILEYDPHELPANLTIYGASDHAASSKNSADYNVLGCVGVDEKEDIWVLPDVVIERMETDKVVEEMLLQMRTHKPDVWWMEDELISKSFGPFLIKRMQEENVFVTLSPKTPTKDKKLRARSIQGRMSMKKVHFPRSAPWWAMAKQQLLKFPYGTNDDFVDWLGWIGLGLLSEYGAAKSKVSDNVVRVGSIAWVKASAAARERREKSEQNTKGW